MSTKSSTNQNKGIEDDELEEEFLKCDINDLPLPKEELKDFEFEINEVMKSGCNRQIAEYALMKYDIGPNLSEVKNIYQRNKDKVKQKVKVEFDTYINNYKNGNDVDEENDEKDEKKRYIEEAEEMLEENIERIKGKENYKYEDNNLIKEFLMSKFKSCVCGADDKGEEFLKSKNNYIEKRDALVESALRLVKKIVNDDNEYKKFYEGYFGKKLEEN